MEMNLIPFFGGIFDPILFGFVAWPAIFLVIAVWVMKSADDQEALSLQGLLQIWSRVTLDSTIVMGICGTMIGIHGIVAGFDIDNPEKQAVYDSVNIAKCESALAKAGLPSNIMVDCSHANSSKDHHVQPLVTRDISNQILKGNKSIVGLMLESHLNEGRQDIPADLKDLKYGVSITDACIDWTTTENSLRELADSLRATLRGRPES